MKYILILLITMSTLFAKDFEHHSEKHMHKELSHINFSKPQKKELKEILKNFRFDLHEFREYKEEIEEKRKTLFTKDELDLQELGKLNNQLDLKARTIENNFLTKVHAILTPKQREEFIHYFDDWEVK